jgi:hypothetical protein
VKRLKWIGLTLLVLLAILVLLINYAMGPIVKAAVEKAGPLVAGVPIKLEQSHFRLLRGVIDLKGFELGNPEGFKTPCAIRVNEVAVDIDVKSLFSDTIVIKRIYIKAPEVTYELGLGKSNIGRILEKLESGQKPAPEEKKSGKKVIIEDFLMEGGTVKLGATLTMGAAAPIPLPAIHLTNLGKEEGRKGASPVEVVKKIFGEIGKSVSHLVTGSVNLVEGGVKKLFGEGKPEEKPAAAAP